MAYISQLDEQQQGRPIGFASSAPGANAQPMGPSASATGNGPHTRFVGFGRYLAANRDAANATAGRVAGGIAAQGQQVQSDLASTQQDFTRRVNGGSLSYGAAPAARPPPGTPVQYVASPGAPPAPPSGGTGTPFAGGNSATMTDAQLEQRAGQKYTGPSALSDLATWGDLRGRADAATDTANASTTAPGLGALLGTPGGGNRRFDEGLVGSVGADRFRSLADRWSKLGATLDASNTASQAQAGIAGARTADAADRYRRDLEARRAAAVAAAHKPITLDRVGDELGPYVDSAGDHAPPSDPGADVPYQDPRTQQQGADTDPDMLPRRRKS